MDSRRPKRRHYGSTQRLWLWHSSSPSAHSLLRTPSSPHPSFTQSPSLPRSLVRDGQTSPDRHRLVVPRSTCPSLSPSPPREELYTRYCSNKHTHWLYFVSARTNKRHHHREEPGKTGAPCVKVQSSSRVPGAGRDGWQHHGRLRNPDSLSTSRAPLLKRFAKLLS